MKLINKSIDKHGAGHVTLRPEDDEDMWHLYNLIQEGDSVRAPAIRRVQNVSSTGSTESHRVRLNLTLQVSRVEFSSSGQQDSSAAADAGTTSGQASGSTAFLNIAGKVISENQHVRLGAHHTLDLEPHRDVRIEKQFGWDSVALGRVAESTVPGRGAEVSAIVCGEGLATFCLLSQHMTVVVHRISTPVPRKSTGAGAERHEKALKKFYSLIHEGFLRHIPFSSPDMRAIVIASPGWVRDSVYDYLVSEATKSGNKSLQAAIREKVIKVHITSPHIHSLVEVLKSPQITAQLKETKFAKEGIMLDRFFKMLSTDEMRAWYGPDHVCLAADRGAIGTLLISDHLFRASDAPTRKRYVELVDAVQSKGGEVVIFSSMHESGQQLNQLTGIAALLTFPLDVEVVEREEREEAERLAAQEGDTQDAG
ncbi:pelota [Flagelloscypha sp. PMI_526]|nr:pelota [Flagelloscypha sp. PMI_526]